MTAVPSARAGLPRPVLLAAGLLAWVACVWAGAAQAQVQLGIGGVDVGMTPDQVAAVVTAQGQRVFSKSSKYVEAVLTDSETSAPVRARFLFDENDGARLKSVEFVEDDDKFVRQYLRWQSRLTKLYGPAVSMDHSDSALRDHRCHSRNVSVQLALFEQRAVLAYFYSPQVSANCARANVKWAFEPVAYDWRPPSKRNELPQPAPPVAADSRAPERSAAAGPSPLSYASHRSPQYQETLRCISVAAFNGSSGPSNEQQFWRGVVNSASGEMVRLGRAEGMSPGQVDAEGRAIVSRHHAVYRQGAEANGTSYIDLDREFCRRRGLIPR